MTDALVECKGFSTEPHTVTKLRASGLCAACYRRRQRAGSATAPTASKPKAERAPQGHRGPTVKDARDAIEGVLGLSNVAIARFTPPCLPTDPLNDQEITLLARTGAPVLLKQKWFADLLARVGQVTGPEAVLAAAVIVVAAPRAVAHGVPVEPVNLLYTAAVQVLNVAASRVEVPDNEPARPAVAETPPNGRSAAPVEALDGDLVEALD